MSAGTMTPAMADTIGRVAILGSESEPSCSSRRISRPTTRKKRSEEHTSELQSQSNLVCRLLLEKKKEIRLTALASLDKIGDARGKPAIKALMKDPEFVVRMRAERLSWDWKKKAKAENKTQDEYS